MTLFKGCFHNVTPWAMNPIFPYARFTRCQQLTQVILVWLEGKTFNTALNTPASANVLSILRNHFKVIQISNERKLKLKDTMLLVIKVAIMKHIMWLNKRMEMISIWNKKTKQNKTEQNKNKNKNKNKTRNGEKVRIHMLYINFITW